MSDPTAGLKKAAARPARPRLQARKRRHGQSHPATSSLRRAPVFVPDGEDDQEEGEQTDQINAKVSFAGEGLHGNPLDTHQKEGESEPGEEAVAGFFPKTEEKERDGPGVEHDSAGE